MPRKAHQDRRSRMSSCCARLVDQAVLPQIETVLKARVPIVTTTEELSYPGQAQRGARRGKSTRWRRRPGSRCLPPGVNPGFVMDALPIALTAACERVDSVTVQPRAGRAHAAAAVSTEDRRRPDARAVRARSRARQLRHVGLAESISMIADALGWQLDRITDEVEPKIAEATVASEFLAVDPGYVSGIIQDGVGYRQARR